MVPKSIPQRSMQYTSTKQSNQKSPNAPIKLDVYAVFLATPKKLLYTPAPIKIGFFFHFSIDYLVVVPVVPKKRGRPITAKATNTIPITLIKAQLKGLY